LTTVGYGDMTSVTVPERLFTIFLMFVGGFAYSYLIGQITEINIENTS